MKKLFTIFLFLFAVATSNAYEVEYLEGARLTVEEEKFVADIAANYGIEKIEKIASVVNYPYKHHIIHVKGVEVIEDRSFSYRTLAINNDNWMPPGTSGGSNSYRIKHLWSSPNLFQQHEGKLLSVSGEEYRASTYNVTIEACEGILSLLLKGQYSLSTEVKSTKLKDVALDEPLHFSKNENNEMYAITFNSKHSRLSVYFVSVIASKDQVEILRIQQIIQ